MIVGLSLLEVCHHLGLPKTVFLPAEKEERIKILICALSVAQGMGGISHQADLCIYFLIKHLKLKILPIP